MTEDEILLFIIRNNGNCTHLWEVNFLHQCKDCFLDERCGTVLNMSNFNFNDELANKAMLQVACNLYLERNPGSEDILFEVLL